MGQEAAGFDRKNEVRWRRFSPIVKGVFCRKTIKAVVQLDRIEVTRIKPEHLVWGYFLRIKRTLPVLVVISGCADTNLTCHERRNVSQLLLRDFLFLLATDAACLPSAVRTDFGKCAMVRFFFAADAAFLMFFFAAFLCFVEAMLPSSIDFQTTA